METYHIIAVLITTALVLCSLPCVITVLIIILNWDKPQGQRYEPKYLDTLYFFKQSSMVISWICMCGCLIILVIGAALIKQEPDKYRPVQEQLYRRVGP